MKKLSINEIVEIVEGATFNLDLDEQVSLYPVISSKEANKDTFLPHSKVLKLMVMISPMKP